MCDTPKSRAHNCLIEHFTVVCSVTWPLNGSEAGGHLVLIQTFLLFSVNKVGLMPTRAFLWQKQRSVSKQGHLQPRCHSKVRSPSRQLWNGLFISESKFKMGFPFAVCTVCGKVVDDTLKSPGYPNDYPNNASCIYVVPIPPDMDMNITFKDFNIEDAASCE